ncbi:Insecticide toxin TcdB like protein, partial [Polaromonas sp. CF318]|uniref:FG-GAP-like repeat-containing protein n=1 Tax=Polaromonas sp. CF318 TaxID=1144318 RepID=UPI00027135E1
FTVQTKAGLTMEYGNTADSRIEAQGKASVRVWAISRISDVKANFMTFSYVEDNANGEYYPSRIDYTGNAGASPVLAPTTSVQFVPSTAARLDVQTAYRGGALIKTAMRLGSVQAYVGTTLVKDYRLEYLAQATSADRSMLASMTQCDGGGHCLPPAVFSWPSMVAGTYTQKFGAVPTTNWDPTKAWVGDFNGDGLNDLMSYYGGNLATFLSNGDGTYTQKVSAVPTTNWDPTKAWTGDFNGDGLTDLLSYYGGNLATFLSNGDGTYTQKLNAVPTTNWDPTKAWTGDFNGDGVTDLMSYYGGNLVTFFSMGDGAYTQKVSAVPTNWDAGRVWIGDFDGDGFTDLMSYYGGNLITFFSNGDSTYTQKVSAVPTTNWDPTKAWTGDFNGDGGTDLMSYYGGNLVTFVLEGSYKRFVTAFMSGGGANTSIGYVPLTSSGTYTKDATPNAAAYPKLDLQYAQYVVSTVASSNGIGGTTTTQYNYGGLKAELGTGRGMLGFRWMKSKNLANNIESYTEFNQNWPFTGSVAKSETRLAGSGNAGVLKRTTNTYAQGMGSATGTTFVYPSQSVEESWDLGGSAYPTVTNAYQYGQSTQYGDPTQISVSNSAGAGKTTVNEYWPVNTGSGNWILGRLKKATVTSVTP